MSFYHKYFFTDFIINIIIGLFDFIIQLQNHRISIVFYLIVLKTLLLLNREIWFKLFTTLALPSIFEKSAISLYGIFIFFKHNI